MTTGLELAEVTQWRSTAVAECLARRGYATQELRMMLQPVIEPVVFGTETDQDSGRTTVPSDDDFLVGRQAKVL